MALRHRIAPVSVSAPKLPWFLFLTTLFSFIAAGMLTLPDYGMSWDEVVRWQSGDRKLNYYLSWFNAEPTPAMSGDRYPGLFDLPLAVFHRIFSGNRMFQGHVLSFAFANLALLSLAFLASTLFGRFTAVLSTLLLVLYPNFYGHAFINPKDIPFMATYLLGMAMVFHTASRWMNLGPPPLRLSLLTGLAIGLAASSRIPGLILLGYAAPLWMVAHSFTQPTSSAASAKAWLRLIALPALHTMIAGFTAFALLFLFLPRLHGDWFSGVGSVASQLHSSANEIPLLFGGQSMTAAEAPRYYAHAFFLISTPVWMLLLITAGTLALIIRLGNSLPSLHPKNCLLLAFLLCTVFPWAYIFITSPALHNGIRHMLWAVGPLLLLGAYGFLRIHHWFCTRLPRFRLLPSILLFIGIASTAAQLVQMHPYQYVSFNFFAGKPHSVINRYETEYWFTANRYLLNKLPKLVPPPQPNQPYRVMVAGPRETAQPFIPDGFSLTTNPESAHFFVANTTFRTDQIFHGKTIYQLNRAGIPIGVIKQLQPLPQP